MDPTAVLNRIRVMAVAGYDGEAVEAFQALDEWISKGGFLPTPWMQAHL